MSGRYLTLDRFNGSLTGLLDNPASPNDVSSPGGLATIQHHWTRGFGGVGDRTPDVFAQTGDRYTQGIYGNLYHPMSHSAINDYYYGPQTAQTQHNTLNGLPYYFESSGPSHSGTRLTGSAARKEYFDKTLPSESMFESGGGDFDMIDNSNIDNIVLDKLPISPLGESPHRAIKQQATGNVPPVNLVPYAKKLPPGALNKASDVISALDKDAKTVMSSLSKGKTYALIMLGALFLAFLTFDFWGDAIHKFMDQKIHQGKPITWQRAGLYAIIMTCIFGIGLYLSGITLSEIEDDENLAM